MATEIEAAIAAELGNHIDDLSEAHDTVVDAEQGSMGTSYADTSQQRQDGRMLAPNEFHILLEDGNRFLVHVTWAGK